MDKQWTIPSGSCRENEEIIVKVIPPPCSLLPGGHGAGGSDGDAVGDAVGDGGNRGNRRICQPSGWRNRSCATRDRISPFGKLNSFCSTRASTRDPHWSRRRAG